MKLFGKKNKKPIENVQVSDRHIALRWVAFAVCLLIGIISIGSGINALLTVNTGWQEVEDIVNGISVADDFVVNYNFGKGGSASSTAYRRISALYSDAAEEAYWLFNKDESKEDGTIVGIRAINDNIGVELTVADVLYDAFALLQSYDNRAIYLAPLYAEHESLLFAGEEAHAMDRDPAHNAEAAAYAAAIAAFASDPEAVGVELLGNNKLRLNVSKEYLAFAKEYEIDTFVDFGWMKNAFITDYFADILIENGFTDGTIASEDGFIRNLDDSGNAYLFNVYDRVDATTYLAGAMQYRGAQAIVSLRAFPVSYDDGVNRYRTYADGSVAHPYLDAATGLRQNALPALIGYSADEGCAQTLMQLMPVYIADAWDDTAPDALRMRGIHTVWCEDFTIHHTDDALEITGVYQDENVTYKVN